MSLDPATFRERWKEVNEPDPASLQLVLLCERHEAPLEAVDSGEEHTMACPVDGCGTVIFVRVEVTGEDPAEE